MKKTILAIAVPAMLAVSAAASAATVYKTDSQDLGIFGRALFKAHHNDNTSSDFSARLGVKGKTKVNDNLSAFFSSQWDMQSNRETLTSNKKNSDTADNIQSRAIYVGLDYGDMGALQLGQDHSPFYSSLTVITDIFDFGGQESYEGTYGKNFNSNLAVYSNHMGPVTVQASYQFKTTSGDDNSAAAIDSIYEGTQAAASSSLEQSNAHSLAVVYDTGYNVNLRAAYARQNFAEKDTTSGSNLEDQTNYGFGVDYTMDNLYVAALYTHAKQSVAGGNDVKQNGYELAAKYNVGKISLLTGYAYGKRDQDGAADVKFAKSFKLGVQYHFTGDIKAIAGWVNNPHDDDQGKNPNTYSAGLQYNF